MKKILLVLVMLFIGRETTAQHHYVFPFRNPELAAGERAEDLVSRLTFEEKISQMVYTAAAIDRLGIPAYNW